MWFLSLLFILALLREVCVPLLEQTSSLKFNQDFFVGYSPERINPGDKQRTP